MKLRYLTYALLGLMALSPAAQVQAGPVSMKYRVGMGALGAGLGAAGVGFGAAASGSMLPVAVFACFGVLANGLAQNSNPQEFKFFFTPLLVPVALGGASVMSFIGAGVCFYKALKSYDGKTANGNVPGVSEEG